MKKSWVIVLDISKEAFFEKLKAVTVPVDLDTINDRSSFRGAQKWLNNFLEQGYSAIDTQYNVEQDITFRHNDLKGKIFLGEVNEDSASLYLPHYLTEGKHTRKMIDSLENI